MGKSGRIYQNKVDAFIARGVNSLDQFVFGVALQLLQVMAGGAGAVL